MGVAYDELSAHTVDVVLTAISLRGLVVGSVVHRRCGLAATHRRDRRGPLRGEERRPHIPPAEVVVLSRYGAGGVPGLEFDGSALSTADPASITRAGGVRLPTPEGPPLSAAGTALAGDAGGVPISTCSWPG